MDTTIYHRKDFIRDANVNIILLNYRFSFVARLYAATEVALMFMIFIQTTFT